MLKHRVSNAGMIANTSVVKDNTGAHTANAPVPNTKPGILNTDTSKHKPSVGLLNPNSDVAKAIDAVLTAHTFPPTVNDDIPIANTDALNASASAINPDEGLNSNSDATVTDAEITRDVTTRKPSLNRASSVLGNTHAGLQALAGVLNANAGLIKQAALSAQTSVPEANSGLIQHVALRTQTSVPEANAGLIQHAALRAHTSVPEANAGLIKQAALSAQTYVPDANGAIDSPEHTMKDKREVFSDSELCSAENRLVHSSSAYTDAGGSVSNEEGIKRINEKYESIGRLTRSVSMKAPTFKDIYSACPDTLPHNKFKEGVTEQDLLQVETFYRGHKTEVFLCGCLANLYFGSLRSSMSNHPWKFSCTGIPLLVLDSGEHHRARKLYIVIAEKGTGFTLWKDVVSNLTGYKAPNPIFHTLHVSTDHTKLAGLSFDDGKKALAFFNHIYKFTSDPNDDLLKIGRIKKSKSMREKKRKIKLPKKTEISQPCCFVHVTKLDSDHVAQDEQEAVNDSGISKPVNFEHITAHRGSVDQSISVDMSNSMETKLKLTSSGSTCSSLSGGK